MFEGQIAGDLMSIPTESEKGLWLPGMRHEMPPKLDVFEHARASSDSAEEVLRHAAILKVPPDNQDRRAAAPARQAHAGPVRHPPYLLSLRNVEVLQLKYGIDICH
ncbi:MAG: hypothetical protein P8Y48_05670 [Novosphingobium sp.]